MSKLNFDHIVIVVMENHSYQEVIGFSDGSAPYINQLAENGLSINNAYGEQHPSQPNYFWLFSGNNQGIMDDHAYSNSGPVFDTPNLYTALEQHIGGGNFFGGYVDAWPDDGNLYGDTQNYANRHVPWLGFKNINSGDPAAITKDFAQFPTQEGADFSSLPLVSMVIPGLDHDMHDSDSSGDGVHDTKTSKMAIKSGDTWLSENLSAYAEWAVNNNSLLIITFDEDSSSDWSTPAYLGGAGEENLPNTPGYTAPNLGPNPISKREPIKIVNTGPNQIPMIFYGANLKIKGHQTIRKTGVNCVNNVNNVNLLRTIESIYGLQPSGAQTATAVKAGLTDAPIPDIFTFDYVPQLQVTS